MARRNQAAPQTETPTVPRLDDLNKSLVLVARCLGALAVRFSVTRPKSDTERIHLLQSLGFDRREIAAILATTPNTVSVRLSERRKRQRE